MESKLLLQFYELPISDILAYISVYRIPHFTTFRCWKYSTNDTNHVHMNVKFLCAHSFNIETILWKYDNIALGKDRWYSWFGVSLVVLQLRHNKFREEK